MQKSEEAEKDRKRVGMKSNVSATDEAIRLMKRLTIFVLFVVDSNLGQLQCKIPLKQYLRSPVQPLIEQFVQFTISTWKGLIDTMIDFPADVRITNAIVLIESARATVDGGCRRRKD